MDIYKLPFPQAKKYLPRVYLRLDFLEELALDSAKLNLKAVYTSTGMTPIVLVNDNISINKYFIIANSLHTEEILKQENPDFSPKAPGFQIGYKYFDKWRFEDGAQIGEFGSLSPNPRFQRLIQREVLGFKKYWILRLLRKI